MKIPKVKKIKININFINLQHSFQPLYQVNIRAMKQVQIEGTNDISMQYSSQGEGDSGGG